MPWHWPGHKYLGPGTKKFEDLPVDQDDWIARDHDRAYDSAQTSEDILQADSHTIQDFINSAIEGNWHSAVSAGLLSVKNTVESTFNSVIYPRKQGMKRTLQDRSPGTAKGGAGVDQVDAPKRQRGPEPDSTGNEGEEDDGFGSGGSAVSGNPIQICRSSEALAFGKSIVFKKSWMLTTWGFQTGPATKASNGDMFYMKTPLAYVPVDVPAFYMSPAEYDQLPYGANAQKCFVKCTSKGYRFPFETNASSVASANSEMVLFGQTATHLNHKYNLGFREYAGTAALPTSIVTGKSTLMDWVKFFYGTKISDSPASLPWMQKRLTHYAIMNLGKDETTADLPTLMNDINTFDLRTAQGTPVLNYDYEFNIAPLKDKVPTYATDYTEGPSGMTDFGFRGMRWDTDGKNGHPLYSLPNRKGHIESNRMYASALEKQQFWRYSSKPEYRLLAQPDCYIGVIPPISSTPFAANPIFQPVMAYWQFDTTLIVDFNLHSTSTKFSRYSASRNRYIPNEIEVMAPQNMQFGFMDGRKTQHMPYPQHEVHPVVEFSVEGSKVTMEAKKTAAEIKAIHTMFKDPKFVHHEL